MWIIDDCVVSSVTAPAVDFSSGSFTASAVDWRNTPIPTQEPIKVNKPPKKKENTMYDFDCGCEREPMDKDARAEHYLDVRLANLVNQKDNALTKAFGLRDDDRPGTAKELIDRITSGKYVVPEERMDTSNYDPIRYFRWRDPSVKEDYAGYDAAMKNMGAAKTDVEDAINVKTKEEALAALKDFESKTFH